MEMFSHRRMPIVKMKIAFAVFRYKKFAINHQHDFFFLVCLCTHIYLSTPISQAHRIRETRLLLMNSIFPLHNNNQKKFLFLPHKLKCGLKKLVKFSPIRKTFFILFFLFLSLTGTRSFRNIPCSYSHTWQAEEKFPLFLHSISPFFPPH
jgi:hypothetical protein